MDALALMQAADRLTGVRPGMSYTEIQARQVSITREAMIALQLCIDFKETRDSAIRAQIVGRLNTLAQGNPRITTLVNQQLARGVSITRTRRWGRPRTHASEEVARREAQRAYRERRKRGETGP